MKKNALRLFLSVAVASLLHALPAGVTGISFTTAQAQFAAGDNITIQEVFATSANLAAGDTVVVRGTYALQSQSAASLAVQVTAPAGSGSQPGAAAAQKSISAGSGTFELQIDLRVTGSLHVTFYSTTTGSAFGGIYFASSGVGTPTTPATPVVTTPPINTAGVAAVAFATSRAQFDAGDAITIREVLATSPRMEPGDTVLVRGDYRLQSRDKAMLLLTLSANAPGFVETTSSSSRQDIGFGSGTFELAYEIKQPGALHVSLYPGGVSGSVFGGVYFAPPGATTATSPAVVNPSANLGRLGNLSIRSLVGTGDNTLVAGVTVTDQERYVLIRGVGPTLGVFGVNGVLRKPLLSVYKANGELMASTGSWSTSYTATQRAGLAMLSQSVGAFALNAGSDDAVLHLRLVPGGYTIVVSSGDGQTGVALIEAYASSTFTLPAPP
jgi:hypothetical protein